MGSSLVAAAAVLVLSGQTLEPAPDGGFTTEPASALRAPRRVLSMHLPHFASDRFVVSDSNAPDTETILYVQGAAGEQARLEDGALRYPGAVNGDDLLVSQDAERSVSFGFGHGQVTLRLLWTGRVGASPNAVEFFADDRVIYRVRADVPLVWTGADLVVLGGATPFHVTVEVGLVTFPDAHPPMLAPSWGASMAWDGDRQKLVRVGGTSAFGDERSTWTWDEEAGWVDLKIPTPPTRVRGAMVWDQARHSLLLFGGSGVTSRLDDTWELTSTGWVQRFPVNHPSARWAHGMAYDDVRQRVVLYGGLDGDGFGTEFEDTWEWDGHDWQLMLPVARPGPRDAHGMAWDPLLREVVLFGGWDAATGLDDTWTWDGTRWREVPTTVRPPRRSSTALAWDPLGQRLVLTGGWDVRSNVYLDDTWAFDGATWTPLPPVPDRWMRAALASHPALGVVAFGGRNDVATFNWTLMLDAVGWRDVDVIPAPGPLVQRPGGLRELSGDWEWARHRARWSRAAPLPFTGASHAASLAGGALAVAATDAGLETWLADVDGGPWTLVDGPATGAAVALASDQRTWLQKDDGSLAAWRASGWSAVALPPTTRTLGGAEGERALLVEDDVIAFEPDAGFTPFLPAPFPDAGHYSLQVDARRGVVIASGGSASRVFAEWVDQRWEPVASGAEHVEWEVRDGLAWAGSLGDGGFAWYQPARFNGSLCMDAAQCASGVCEDGRCCERACGADATDCQACSVEAGGQRDGFCTPLRVGVQQVCGGDGACLVAWCTPGVTLCPSPSDICPSDAGPVVRAAGHPMPRADAGTDGGTEPGDAAAGCQCGAVDGGLLACATLLALVRRRRAAAS